MPSEESDRLFVPLKTEPFEWFESGEKDVELRGYGHRFNMETVVPGRPVQLVKGYNPANGSLWGRVEHVQTFPYNEYSDDEVVVLPEGYDYQRINPTVETEAAFQQSVADILGEYGRYIAFQVALDLACIECGDGIQSEDDAVYGAGGLTDEGAERLSKGERVGFDELFAFDDGPYCTMDCLLAIGDGGEDDV